MKAPARIAKSAAARSALSKAGCGQEERSSFLKKRSKKLLFVWESTFPERL
jgi:hypothetical protein